jgi:S1-C subfamily serine protease
VFDALDGVLGVAVLLFAVSGYRQGFVVGALSFVGFLGGGLVGAQIAQPFARGIGANGGNGPLVGLLVVVACAVFGQVGATAVGAALRGHLTWRPGQAVDAVAGAVLSGLSVLLVAWLLATAVNRSPFTGLARQARDSAVLTTVDAVMPNDVQDAFSTLRQLMDRNGFPEVFSGLSGERIAPVGPPDPAVTQSAAVTAAGRSVIKVRGIAPSCSKQVEGSGFVFAPEHVMTNAHVVAGVRQPTVIIGDTSLRAQVVLFDPDRDVAVLWVPGLSRPALTLLTSQAARAGTSAVVAGYPEDGPYTTGAARVRDRLTARAPDIYAHGTVVRDIYSVRATVRPGNSGGPLLSTSGSVYGVVFAAATDDPQTGYALTGAEVATDARAARSATTAVSTRGCD